MGEIPALAAGVERNLLCCKALGTTVFKGVLQNASLGANAQPPGNFVVDLSKKKFKNNQKNI